VSLPVVLYAAKSTTDKMGSIPDQIKACEELAASQGWTVDGRPESDEAASAYSGNRGPGLERAMDRAAALAKRHGRAGLVAWHSNRIARGGADSPDASRHLVEYLFWANRANVELHSVQDDSTFSNPILAAVMGQMAYEESKIKAANVRKGMGRRRAKRLHTGGAIFGYDRDPERGLKPNPAQAATVERIFSLIAGGKSQAETARILNREGFQPLRGKEWSQGSLSAILRRRTYLGDIKDDNGEWVPAAHEAIVSVDLWDAANRAREDAAALKGRNGGPRPKAGHLLPGRMLRHAVCGHAMTPVSLDAKKDGTITGRYECSGRKAGVCEGFRVDMEDVDNAITSYLAEVGIDADASLRLVSEATASRREATGAELNAARREAANAEAAFQRIRRDYMDGKITADDWQEFRGDLETERVAARARVERLEAQVAEGDSAEIIVPAVADALSLIRSAMGAGDTDAVRAAVESLFSEFMVGEAGDLPEEAIVGDPAARVALQRRVAELDAKTGRSLAEAEAQYWQEEAAMEEVQGFRELPPADDPLNDGLWPSDRVVILPTPREDALQAIVEDGQPVYLVDEHGRSMFKRLPLPVTYNDGLAT
jgi:DNA invertase Pin-like site-specific DNA recombinase